jgi:hypothetical protein
MNQEDLPGASARWARLRFAIVGRLLASPPKRGELGAELRRLAQQFWKHPSTGERVQFGRSTIERWYYAAKRQARDPMGALRRKGRKDAGLARRVTDALLRALRLQHKEHPGWSYKLHHDNLQALAEENERLRPVPSYTTVRRTMKRLGLTKVRSRSRRRSEAGERAARRLEKLGRASPAISSGTSTRRPGPSSTV